jgi:hypothetical protein
MIHSVFGYHFNCALIIRIILSTDKDFSKGAFADTFPNFVIVV